MNLMVFHIEELAVGGPSCGRVGARFTGWDLVGCTDVEVASVTDGVRIGTEVVIRMSVPANVRTKSKFKLQTLLSYTQPPSNYYLSAMV